MVIRCKIRIFSIFTNPYIFTLVIVNYVKEISRCAGFALL